MSDSILETLRNEGELESRGGFELHEAKARQKLQKFRLADPHEYVLEFVQAAHLLGAGAIDIYVDSDEFEMEFDGESLARADLENLFGSAFADGGDARTRAVRHLAIGATAAREVQPKRIVVETEGGADEEPARLTIRPGGENRVESGPGPSSGSVRIYLVETFRLSHVTDFFHRLRGNLVEQTLIEERCRWADIPIEMNGVGRVSEGKHLEDEVLEGVEFSTDHEHGVVGVRRVESVTKPSDERVSLVTNGVSIAEHVVDCGLGGLAVDGVVESQRLTKDLSRADFVEDEAWRELTERVLPSVAHGALATYLEGLSGLELQGDHGWLVGLAGEIYTEAFFDWMNRQIEHPEYDGTETKRLVDAVAELPLWPAGDDPAPNEGEPRVELGEFELLPLNVFETDDGEFRVSERHCPGVRLEDASPVLLEGAELPVVQGPRIVGLPEIVRRRAVDITARLEAKKRRQIYRSRWEQREPYEVPEADRRPYGTTMEVGGYEVTIRFGARANVTSRLDWVKGDRLLRTDELSELSVPDLLVSIVGDLPVNETYEDVVPDGGLRRAAAAAIEALPGVVEQCVEQTASAESSWVGRWVVELFEGDVLQGLLAAFRVGSHPELADGVELVGILDDWVWRLDPNSAWRVAALDERPSEELRDRVQARLGALWEAPVFRTLEGDRLSLAGVDERIRADGELWFAGIEDGGERRSRAEFRRSRERAGVERPILWCDAPRARVLQTLWSEVYECTEVLLRRGARARFMDQPTVEARLEDAFANDMPQPTLSAPRGRRYMGTRRLDGSSWDGEIGLRIPANSSVDDSASSGELDLMLLYENRPLTTRTVSVPAGAFEAVVNCDAVDPGDGWNDVTGEGAWPTLAEAVRRAAKSLLLKSCRWTAEHIESVEARQQWRAASWVAALARDGALEEALDVPVFAMADGSVRSYRELKRQLASVTPPRLGYVEAEVGATDQIPITTEDSVPVVRVPPVASYEDTLRAGFPEARTVEATGRTPDEDEGGERRQKTARRKFLLKAAKEVSLREAETSISYPGGESLREVGVDEPAMRAKIGLYPAVEVPDDWAVRYLTLYEQRELTVEAVDVPVGRFLAVLETDWIEPTGDWSGIGGGRQEIEASLQEGCRVLWKRWLDECSEPPGGLTDTGAGTLRVCAASAYQRDPSTLGDWKGVIERLVDFPVFRGAAGTYWSIRGLARAAEAAEGRIFVVDSSTFDVFAQVQSVAAEDFAEYPLVLTGSGPSAVADTAEILGVALPELEVLESLEALRGSGAGAGDRRDRPAGSRERREASPPGRNPERPPSERANRTVRAVETLIEQAIDATEGLEGTELPKRAVEELSGLEIARRMRAPGGVPEGEELGSAAFLATGALEALERRGHLQPDDTERVLRALVGVVDDQI